MKLQDKKIQELHSELLEWRSNIDFIEDEMHFIDRLLHSYVFEPRTPNLFERLEQFKIGMESSRKRRESIRAFIMEHENNLGGMLECTSTPCDTAYYVKHEQLQSKVFNYLEDYRKLKSEIYRYAGGILKSRKPVS